VPGSVNIRERSAYKTKHAEYLSSEKSNNTITTSLPMFAREPAWSLGFPIHVSEMGQPSTLYTLGLLVVNCMLAVTPHLSTCGDSRTFSIRVLARELPLCLFRYDLFYYSSGDSPLFVLLWSLLFSSGDSLLMVHGMIPNALEAPLNGWDYVALCFPCIYL
jgi:hypothetical protein